MLNRFVMVILQHIQILNCYIVHLKLIYVNYWNQIDFILCSWRWRSSILSAKTRLGANCGSDHELFIAKFRLKLKKAGKTTRPFRYDLNQIPYYYTVEVRNRFKGLDLIDRVPDELWTEFLYLLQIYSGLSISTEVSFDNLFF